MTVTDGADVVLVCGGGVDCSVVRLCSSLCICFRGPIRAPLNGKDDIFAAL